MFYILSGCIQWRTLLNVVCVLFPLADVHLSAGWMRGRGILPESSAKECFETNFKNYGTEIKATVQINMGLELYAMMNCGDH
jgi:hypothetical protein